MLDLRLERERLELQGVLRLDGALGKVRQQATRTLAQAYPGALKQLDTMDSATIERRLEILESVGVSSGEDVPEWCELEACFHALLSDFLAAKRWLGEHGAPELSDGSIWASWQESGLFATDGWQAFGLDEGVVQSVRRPPEGRMTSLVWKTLAQRFREPADVLKARFAAWQEES